MGISSSESDVSVMAKSQAAVRHSVELIETFSLEMRLDSMSSK
jgi:hypothetical protein